MDGYDVIWDVNVVEEQSHALFDEQNRQRRGEG